MGFGSFLQGIVAQVNPFDNGKTYGSYNPPKRKPQPGDPGYVAPAPAPRPAPQAITPQAQSTQNVFSTIQNSLKLPGAAPVAPAVQTPTSLPSVAPSPGTVVRPTVTRNGETGTMVPSEALPGHQVFVPNTQSIPKKPGFWGHVGNGLKTAGQTAVNSVANIPEVAGAAVRTGTGIVEGATQIPHLLTALAATGTQKLNQAAPSKFTHALNTGVQGVNTGTKAVTNGIDAPLNYVNKKIDQGASLYARNVPGASAGANVYRNTQIPLNVLAALVTAGGSEAGEGGAAAEDASKVPGFISRFLNKPITDNPDSLISKASDAVTNKTAPVVKVINSPIKSSRSGITQLLNNRNVPTALQDVVSSEAGNVMNGVEDLTRPPTNIPVSAPQSIEVGGTPSEPQTVPVTNNTPTGSPIVEVGGDKPGSVAVPTPQQVAADRASSQFSSQLPGHPDPSIEGVSKADTGNASPLFTKSQLANEQAELDDALKNGDIDPATHKAASDELAKNAAVDDAPKGRKIDVKQVDSIPVQNQAEVATDLPNTPGKVKVTTSTAPEKTESEAIAKTPTAAAPTPIPKVGSTLPDGTTVTKRMVQAARNNAKNAKKYVKAKEDTDEAITRLTSDKPAGDKGFVSSGEFKKGANGNVSEVAHRNLEAAQGAHDTASLSVDDVLKQSKDDINENGVHSPSTVRNLKALRDSGRFARTSPEFKAINDEYKSAISNHGRALALTDHTARTSATGDQLTNRFTSKLLSYADDSGKIKDSDISQVTDAEHAFTNARDAANQAGEQFKATGSDSDFKAWKDAQTAADTADRHARLTEYLVSKRVLKGNKNIEASKAVADAEKNAGVYSMDAIDSNMLSGTGTMVRNYINTLFPRAENKLFGRASAFVARKVTGIDALGGSSGKGARIGSSIGRDTYKADLAARKEAGVGRLRRAVTAGNTIGEQNIEATTYSKAFSHYKQLLSDEGYKGKELNNRAEFEVRGDDSKGLVAQYQRDTLQANALSGLTHNKKFENILSDSVQKALANAGVGHAGQVAGRTAAKLVTRVAVGFPTVIAHSLVEGLKRATLGIPEAALAGGKFALGGNKEEFAASLAKSLQHAGTGGALMTLGAALGRAGLITGAYPTDKNEQARWTAEGKQENSINIGGSWYSIPGYLGGFALPLMFGATSADGSIKDEATWKNAYSTVLSSSPVSDIQSTAEILSGNSTDPKIKNAITSVVRSATPAGAFVAEVAKLSDSTQNDTTTKDTLHNILDSIASGIPGLNNKVNTIPKLDEYGNTIKNPNPVATVLGAQGAEQSSGAQDVEKQQSASDATLKQLSDYGVTSNKSLMQLVDPKLAKQIETGQQLSPQDVIKVQNAVTKGISATEDSNWRESGDYTTDKSALQAKLQLLDADPTTKPSVKQSYQTQINRDDVLSSNGISYDQFKEYEDTGLTAWRDMGNPKSDAYDPDTYSLLWAIDQKMAAGGGSYNKTDPTAQRFSAKASSGSGSSSSYSADFGKLKDGAAAPTVQAYQTPAQQSGSIPVIQRVRPNIVHKISSSG